MSLLENWINFFPYSYKERDTYKVNGKGILERFLDICSNYLVNYVTPDIDNALELIDLDNVPPMYLNYMWEYLGAIPFAYGVSIDKDKFDKYYNGLRTKEELQELSKVWVIEKKGPVILQENDVRHILKYAITLTKIRGTKRFFEVLFKLYGFDCTINDPILDDKGTLWDNKDKPVYDSEYYKYDQAKSDLPNRCSQCTTVNVDISTGDSLEGAFLDINGEFFYDSKSIIYGGKYDDLIEAYADVDPDVVEGPIVLSDDQDTYLEQNESAIFTGLAPASLSDFNALRRMVIAILDRYLPYNVKAHITFNGLEIDDDITLTVEPYNPEDPVRPNMIFTGSGKRGYVQYSVKVTSLWPYTDLRYKVSGDGVIWGNPHDEEILTLTKPGTYYIRPVTEDYKGSSYMLVINTMLLNMWYSLEYRLPKGTEFGPDVTQLYIDVKGVKHQEVINNEGDKVVDSSETKVINILGNYSSLVRTEDGYFRYGFTPYDTEDDLGIQTVIFALREKYLRQLTVNLTRVPEVAWGYLDPASINYKDLTNNTYVEANIGTNYFNSGDGGKYLKLVCRDTGEVIRDKDEWRVSRDGVTRFYIDRNYTKNTKQIARAKAIVIPNPDITFTVDRSTPDIVTVQSMKPLHYIYPEVGYATLLIKCEVLLEGKTESAVQEDYDCDVYLNGESKGILNCYDWTTYNVTEVGEYTFISKKDPYIKTSVLVQTPDVIGGKSGLFIHPDDKDDDTMWDTTYWVDDDERGSATALGGYADIWLHLYINGQRKSTGIVRVAKVNLAQNQYIDIGSYNIENLIRIEGEGVYQIMENTTSYKATLTIKP